MDMNASTKKLREALGVDSGETIPQLRNRRGRGSFDDIYAYI